MDRNLNRKILMDTFEYMEPTELMVSGEINDANFPVNYLHRSSPSDYVWSFLGVMIIIFIFLLQEPAKMMHWMLLPLSLCGTIVMADAIRWFKGTYTLLDPKGIIGLYGINFFLIAPLLIVFYDVEKTEEYVLGDWKLLLGLMAAFNVIGLIVYKIFEKIAFKRPSKVQWTYWTLNPGRAAFFVPVFVTLAFSAFCVFIVRGGGLSGLLLQERQGEMNVGLVGMGWLAIIRDSLPLTGLIALTVFRMTNAHAGKSPWWVFVGMGVLVMFILTSGLRGSRAAIGFGLICASGMIHYFWRRLKVSVILLSLIPLLFFFYFYSFYKSAGIAGISDLVQGRRTVESLQESTQRTFVGMLIGDLSRAHIQAAELDVLVNKPFL